MTADRRAVTVADTLTGPQQRMLVEVLAHEDRQNALRGSSPPAIRRWWYHLSGSTRTTVHALQRRGLVVMDDGDPDWGALTDHGRAVAHWLSIRPDGGAP